MNRTREIIKISRQKASLNKNEVLRSMQEKISSMYPDLEISMEPEFTDTEE